MAKDQKSIPGSEFFKSLVKLEAMAKGSDPKKEENGEDMNKAQLFHTPTNSDRNSWAGGDTDKYSDKWDDKIKDDGTDYTGMRKAIASKVMKGLPLTPEEVAILKGDLENTSRQAPSMKYSMEKANMDEEENKDKPASEEKDKSISKSLEKEVTENETLQKGLEVSEFLSEFAKSFAGALDRLEKSTARHIESATNSILQQVGEFVDMKFSEQGEFNKSLAEAVVNIGHGVAGTIEQQSEMASMPAHAPKSVQAAEMQKSMMNPQASEAMMKSMKLDALCDLVEKGQVSPIEVTKFEVTGQIRPELDAQISRMLQSGGQQ